MNTINGALKDYDIIYLVEIMTGCFDVLTKYLLYCGTEPNGDNKPDYFLTEEKNYLHGSIEENTTQKYPYTRSRTRGFVKTESELLEHLNADLTYPKDTINREYNRFIYEGHPNKFSHMTPYDFIDTVNVKYTIICMPTTVNSFCIMAWYFLNFYPKDLKHNEPLSGRYEDFIKRITGYYYKGTTNLNSKKHKLLVVDINDLFYNKCLEKFYENINEQEYKIDFEKIYAGPVYNEIIKWVNDFKKTEDYVKLENAFYCQTEFLEKLKNYKIIRG